MIDDIVNKYLNEGFGLTLDTKNPFNQFSTMTGYTNKKDDPKFTSKEIALIQKVGTKMKIGKAKVSSYKEGKDAYGEMAQFKNDGYDIEVVKLWQKGIGITWVVSLQDDGSSENNWLDDGLNEKDLIEVIKYYKSLMY